MRSTDFYSERYKPIFGLLLVSSITLISYLLFYLLDTRLSFNLVSVISIAIFISVITTNIWNIPETFHPGIKFSLNQVLSLAIILLGLRLHWSEIALVGSTGLVIIILSLVFTFITTYWLGRRLGLNLKLVQLIACGTSICGTSAIIAVNGVVHASEDDVACSVVTVTALGTIAMFLYPLLSGALQLTPEEFGLWCGSSIHQTSQVVAASFQQGLISGEIATISKLSRVMFLAPIVFLVGLLSPINRNHAVSNQTKFKLPIPLFIIIFLGVICLNSFDIIPQNIKENLIVFDKFLIAVAMVAVGLETKLSKLKQAGLKPLLLGAASWFCLSVTSLCLIKIFI